ncbi:hypothetical protein ACSBR1_042642 [Camellia fascicularis]
MQHTVETSETMEHDRWSLLQTQTLEAQHCHCHGWYLPHLHLYRHEICQTRGIW